MDEGRLQEILSADAIPPAEDNARKEAINLALVAFDQAQREAQQGHQGTGLPGRLTGRDKQRSKGRPMSRTLVLLGLATTVALALLSVAALQDDLLRPSRQQAIVESSAGSDPAEPPILASRDAPGGLSHPADPRVESGPAQTLDTAPSTRTAETRPPETAAESIAEKAPPPAPSATTTPRVEMAEAPPPMPATRPLAETKPVAPSPPAKEPRSGDAERKARLAELRARLDALEAKAQAHAQAGSSSGLSQQALPGSAGLAPVDYRRRREAPLEEARRILAEKTRPAPRHEQDVGRDQFESAAQNPVRRVAEDPVSTFSIDVDTASYAFVRRQLHQIVLPQKDAVRIEELINYFDYAYPLPAERARPFAPSTVVTPSPWKDGNKLIHIGIKGYDLAPDEKPRSNLVFLLDVSGSMDAPDKLPLVVRSMKLLLDGLEPEDTVAIVTYAGDAGTVLEPTAVAERRKILAALDRLGAGGSTAGAEGIRQAYALAEAGFDPEAVNRVILATDGDFNVGITDRDELKGFIERKRESGVFLSVLGFGQGNLNDHLMQTLAQNGNGVAAHIDTLNEARKVLVEEAASALFPIAKDVKIQVEFNPRTVAEYRLIGYETRALKREDFVNDRVEAGDIGAGHTVTAIYEITPVGSGNELIEPSRYGSKAAPGDADFAPTDFAQEYAFLKIRYKLPDQDSSTLITTPITLDQETALYAAGTRAREARFATAVAAFGQILKGGTYTGAYGYDEILTLARSAEGEDPFGYRAEFLNLVRLARIATTPPQD